MGNRIFVVLFAIIFSTCYSLAQQDSHEFSVLFYNVENLFDTQDNPETEDDNFTPEGEMRWTNKRFNTKLLNISKVILSASGWNVPDVLVLCEIENRGVLESLLKQTPLHSFPYKIIHKESPDHRGIDVAMIYNPKRFTPLEYQYYPLIVKATTLNTREILYVSGVLNGTDTLHIFGNHWPSRYSGLLETKGFRKEAATLLRDKVDALNVKYNFPKILILGDFNDNPEDEAISKVLKAGKMEEPVVETNLYNLFFELKRDKQGSMKFQSQWFIFDQIIVSGSLLTEKAGIFVQPKNAKILSLPFLLEKDEKFGGLKLFRTYYGFTYQGGFSDHLPVMVKFNPGN